MALSVLQINSLHFAFGRFPHTWLLFHGAIFPLIVTQSVRQCSSLKVFGIGSAWPLRTSRNGKRFLLNKYKAAEYKRTEKNEEKRWQRKKVVVKYRVGIEKIKTLKLCDIKICALGRYVLFGDISGWTGAGNLST